MNKVYQPELFCHSQCELGEGIFYFEGKLFWFDINKKYFYSCKEDGSALEHLQLDEQFSTGACVKGGGLLLVSETGLWHFDPSISKLEKQFDLEVDNPVTRSNDGRGDRQGGFWIGTMGKKAETDAGSLYRYYQGKMTKLRGGISIPNAICFSPNGDCAYFADSKQQFIYRWALDINGWPKGDPRVWVDLSDTNISPDGAMVDREGCVWNAQWDGSRMVRYKPNGSEDSVIELPISRPTCPAFGGDKYQYLFISSAREGLTPQQLKRELYAGSVFRVSLNIAGLPDIPVVL